MASDTITREDWKFFIEKSNVSNYLKGFQGVAYITNVPKKHLQNHSNRFKKEFSKALPLLEDVLKQNPDDKAARIYLERLANFIVNPVNNDWEGIESMNGK